jgi:hypothetical protein
VKTLSFVAVYLAFGAVTGALVLRAVRKMDQGSGDVFLDSLIAVFGAFLWPLALAGLIFWWGVRYAYRKLFHEDVNA